ncbi:MULTISPECIES: helix-turn-helix transcriptional regulator [Clostridia]|uniref:helix-turn-helix transcriptional regulator n=1 Tax=Clostridia TaxID=186801 RepID=UPI001FA74376|nr:MULTISPECIES: helix-turn-helix transcriptional regulator [Clostridia]
MATKSCFSHQIYVSWQQYLFAGKIAIIYEDFNFPVNGGVALANIQLVKNLKRYRTARKLTQKELGKMLNISRQAYSNYETGKRTPDLDLLLKIAQIYNITLDDLIKHPYRADGIIHEDKGPFQPGIELLTGNTIYLSEEEVAIVLGVRNAGEDVKAVIKRLLAE